MLSLRTEFISDQMYEVYLHAKCYLCVPSSLVIKYNGFTYMLYVIYAYRFQ